MSWLKLSGNIGWFNRRVLLIILVLSLIILIAGCTNEPGGNGKVNLTKNQPVKLESVLYQLTQSTQPNEFATERGLYVKNGKVRVVIELENKTGTIPAGYGIVEETRYDGLVQAMVPINSLIGISRVQGVKVVRVPQKPVLNTGVIAGKTAVLPKEGGKK